MIPAPTLRRLDDLSGETGYDLRVLEQVVRLLGLLQEIADDPFLGSRLALKGGTALNVFHLGLPRLSVDLDLNYVGALKREAMLAERPRVEQALAELLRGRGYVLARRPTEHAGGKWRARFASALGGNAAVKIDTGYMARLPLFGAARMDSARLGDVQARGIPVVDLHEVAAGKLVALTERNVPRDLFDARSILAMPGIDRRKLKAAALALGASSREDWRSRSPDDIRAFPPELHPSLMSCLPADRFAGPAEVHAWTRETVALCRERFAFLFERTPEERAFLDGVLDRGEVDAGLLDVEPEVRARIAAMPALAWKCRNVRRHRNLEP